MTAIHESTNLHIETQSITPKSSYSNNINNNNATKSINTIQSNRQYNDTSIAPLQNSTSVPPSPNSRTFHESDTMYECCTLVERHIDQYDENDIVEPEYTNDEQNLISQFKHAVTQKLAREEPWLHPAKHRHWLLIYKEIIKLRGAENVYECNKIIDLVGAPSDGMHEYDSNCWGNHTLIRFIRARKGNIDAAVDMYYNYIVWRAQYGTSDLKKTHFALFHTITSSFVQYTWHGPDRHLRPIWIYQVGKMDTYQFDQCIDQAMAELTHVCEMESMLHRLQCLSLKYKKRIDKVVNIMDIKGVGLGHRKLMKFMKTTAYIDQNYYPEILGALYLVNAPSLFPAIWTVAKTFVDPVTQQKIKVLGNRFHPVLDEELGDNVPQLYGGKCQCQGGCISSLNPIPHQWLTGPQHVLNPSRLDAAEDHEVEQQIAGADNKGEYQTVHLRPKQKFAINLSIRPDLNNDLLLDQTEPLSASRLDVSVIKLNRGSTADLSEYDGNTDKPSRGSRATSAGDNDSSDEQANFKQSISDDTQHIVWWEWSSSTKDLEFEVDFITNTHGTISIIPHSTFRHGSSVVRGRYVVPHGLSGTLRLIWSNHASWITNKQLKYRTGASQGKHGVSQPATPANHSPHHIKHTAPVPSSHP